MKKSPKTIALPPVLSPLVLESVRVISIEMTEVNRTVKLSSLNNTMSITPRMDEELATCTVAMDVSVTHGVPDKGMYLVRARVEGRYGFQPGVPEALRRQLVPLHPAVNLLGFLRGMLFQATASLPCGPIFLPLFDLSGMITKHDNSRRVPTKKTVAAKAAPGSSPRRTKDKRKQE